MKKMVSFFKRYVGTEHNVIATDEELVTVLRVLEEYDVHDFNIETCGWADQMDWCLRFKVSDAIWSYIVEDLRKEGLEDHYVVRKMS
jgi:hypothetical protein